jgi:hypothetical protein
MLRKRASSEIERLPDARKALAERYTIDADEAQRREELAAEEASARRVAEEDAAEQAAAEQAAAEVVAAAVVHETDGEEGHSADAEDSAELPIYRWFGNT